MLANERTRQVTSTPRLSLRLPRHVSKFGIIDLVDEAAFPSAIWDVELIFGHKRFQLFRRAPMCHVPEIRRGMCVGENSPMDLINREGYL